MAICRARLDRFLVKQPHLNKKTVRLLLAQQRVVIDGIVETSADCLIDYFTKVEVDGAVLQNNIPHYIMLHKPVGVVSATVDDKHKTVIDLLNYDYKSALHLVGRLDLNTSGLVLLTNDSRWSERLTQPDNKVEKKYLVTLANPITEEYAKAFEQGMYFAFEGIMTKPAKFVKLSTYQAQVTLEEGRYHQIKRMFGRFRNPVVALHRYSIGSLTLDKNLLVGQSRVLTIQEVVSIF
mgnify:CR=1 FL=1